jgi:hypothetical protein
MVVGGRRAAACASFLGLRPLDGWLRLVKAVVNEVGPPLRHLPLSIAQEVSGPPGTLAPDAEIGGGPISLHTAIGLGLLWGGDHAQLLHHPHSVVVTAGCIDTDPSAGRRYFGISDRSLIETTHVHHAMWVMSTETCCYSAERVE